MQSPENILVSQPWKDYELLDFGAGRKLERFGKWVLNRPEPCALSKPKYSKKQWEDWSHLKFISGKESKGTWTCNHGGKMQAWEIQLPQGGTITLKPTQFKHIGIFPEQAYNWNWVKEYISKLKTAKVLNLFAYTGAASIEAGNQAQQVTHVESLKQIMSWAKDNGSASKLQNIRWIQDDAFKFITKEGQRGNNYDVIIMDPPTFGRGPKGEKWKIEEKLEELIKLSIACLNPRGIIVLNTYSQNIDIEKQLSELAFLRRYKWKYYPLGIYCPNKKENLILGGTTQIQLK